MTDLLYQTDAYLKEFEAEVVSLNEEENGIVLNRTAFYPGGGGNPMIQVSSLLMVKKSLSQKLSVAIYTSLTESCL